MKIVIKESELGFLFRHGVFVRMLEPGRHTVYPTFGYTVEKGQAEGVVQVGSAASGACAVDEKQNLFTEQVKSERFSFIGLAFGFLLKSQYLLYISVDNVSTSKSPLAVLCVAQQVKPYRDKMIYS